MAKKTIVTPEQKEFIIDNYVEMSNKAVMEATGLSVTTVRKIGEGAGLRKPSRANARHIKLSVLKVDVLTMSMREMATKYKVSVSSLHYHMQGNHIHMPPIVKVKVSEPWNKSTGWCPITCQ